MPLFRTNQDIFKTSGEEVSESFWFDQNTIHTPKTGKWDYKRNLTVDDIEIWEAIYEDSWGLGIYAAYRPYAEFYMIKHVNVQGITVLDTHYGANAQNSVIKFMIQNNIPVPTHKVWIDNEDMWLYTVAEKNKTIIT